MKIRLTVIRLWADRRPLPAHSETPRRSAIMRDNDDDQAVAICFGGCDAGRRLTGSPDAAPAPRGGC